MSRRLPSIVGALLIAALLHALSGDLYAQQSEEPDAPKVEEPQDAPEPEASDPSDEPAATAEAEAAPGGPTADPALNPLAALDKRSLDAFRNLPLFTPSRRRPEPPPPVEVRAPPPAPKRPPPPPPAPPELSLAGVAIGPEGAVAVIQEQGESRVERLRLGDQVGGWLVTAIDPDGLKVSLDEREHQYRLFEKKEASGDPGAADPEDEVAPRKKPRRPPPAGRNSFGHNGNGGGNGGQAAPRRNMGGDGPEGQE